MREIPAGTAANMAVTASTVVLVHVVVHSLSPQSDQTARFIAMKPPCNGCYRLQRLHSQHHGASAAHHTAWQTCKSRVAAVLSWFTTHRCAGVPSGVRCSLCTSPARLQRACSQIVF